MDNSTSRLLLFGTTAAAGDVATRAAARVFLASRDLDLGAITLMLRIHRTPTFFGFVPLPQPVLMALGTGLVVLLLSLGLFVRSIGPMQRLGALLAGVGGLTNGIELLCCGVSDLIAVRLRTWQSPIFNLGDVYLVLGVLLIFVAPRALASGPK